jgi:O-antigen ligase
MKPPAPPKSISGGEPLAKAYAGLFGVFLGLTLIKFTNVAIFERLDAWPTSGWEWAINTWPVSIGYWLLGLLAVAGALVARREIRRWRWLVALPLTWLAWQFISAMHSVDPGLSRATVKHFSACVTCFYLGYFALGRLGSPVAFLSGMIAALMVVIVVGFQQHFGGLEDSRRYFFTYVYPQMPSVPPEYLKKISSTRIFSTLFYPNALAGALLLLIPAALTVILNAMTRLTLGARRFVAGLVGGGGLACLYWSGSKGGWLLMLLLGMIALLRLPFARRAKLALVGLAFVVGLAGFGIKYARFFRQGATSVGARFDYWQAAVRTAADHPVLGTGPGTFAISYSRIKRPESEMAKLVHNDYLQQASDSGFVGLAMFGAFVLGILIFTRARQGEGWGAVRVAVWLGLVGWWLQGFLEFGLYIPALAWCGFALMGWLLATAGKPFDKPATSA